LILGLFNEQRKTARQKQIKNLKKRRKEDKIQSNDNVKEEKKGSRSE
jgi:hypothetical protein